MTPGTDKEDAEQSALAAPTKLSLTPKSGKFAKLLLFLKRLINNESVWCYVRLHVFILH